MKNFILYFLLAILVGEIIYLVIPKSKVEQSVLAEETSLPTEMPTPTNSPTPSPSPSPSPSPTEKPTPRPTPVPKPTYTSEQINEFINRFAGQYAVDPNVLRHIALCESGFNPSAYKAGYAGLYQFGATTWKNLRLKIGENPDPDLRYNAEEAVQTAAFALSSGDGRIWPNCQP